MVLKPLSASASPVGVIPDLDKHPPRTADQPAAQVSKPERLF